MSDETTGAKRRCAIVFNPKKISDTFRDNIEAALQDGWDEPLWLETTADDPGQAMTAQAVEEKVDLVVAAGGDGTIRMVAAGLAGTGINCAVIPAGTGNLLARNLGIPLVEAKAIEVALGKKTRTIDLVSVSIDDGDAETFSVMAGIGIDAAIMDNTDGGLKAKIGSAAYFIAASRQLGRKPVKATVTVDDDQPLKRKASLCLVGNVGALQADIQLIPGAEPDDGLLDVMIASPRRVHHWLHLLARIATRRPKPDDRVDHLTGRRVSISLEQADRYQLDGDPGGECRTLAAEVMPGALVVMVPAA